LATLVVMLILLLGTSQVTGQEDGPQSLQGTYGYAFIVLGWAPASRVVVNLAAW
jgi:hypothetical protein